MGCSPSHAVIINQSPTQETICLQPRIYMVSESTLGLLQEVGELRVYHVDERNPETAIERFRGAQDQLQNPLSFHPHLRSARRERLNTSEVQAAGSSSVSSEPTEENVRVRIEVFEEQCDGVVDDVHSDSSSKVFENDVLQTTEIPESPNAHSVTVEVYSYKQSSDGLQEERETEDNLSDGEKNFEKVKVETSAPSVTVVATQQNQTFGEQCETNEKVYDDAIDTCDTLKDATLIWSETMDEAKQTIENEANHSSATDQAVFTRILSETTPRGKESTSQELELSENIDD